MTSDCAVVAVAANIDEGEQHGEEGDIIMRVRMDIDQLSGGVTSGLELTTTGSLY